MTLKLLSQTESWMKKHTWLDCPAGMEHEEGECPLPQKTMCGLVQSAHQHFKKFEDVLTKKMGFGQCRSDPCSFHQRHQDGPCVILCCVDDNSCIGNRKAIDKAPQEIKSHGSNMTAEEELTDCLSCEIQMNEE